MLILHSTNLICLHNLFLDLTSKLLHFFLILADLFLLGLLLRSQQKNYAVLFLYLSFVSLMIRRVLLVFCFIPRSIGFPKFLNHFVLPVNLYISLFQLLSQLVKLPFKLKLCSILVHNGRYFLFFLDDQSLEVSRLFLFALQLL